MSKPNPSITANLLTSVLGKPETHHEDLPARPGKQAHPETQTERTAPKPPKLKAAKNSPSGQSRMRSCSRGK